MRLRKGFYRIAAQRLSRGDLGWLLRQAGKYYRIKKSLRRGDGKARAGPIVVHLFSTNRCDSRCVMCDLPARPVEYEFTTDDFRRLLGRFKEMGVNGLSFTGGEPTLRKDIGELLALSRRADLDTILVTNALTLDRHIEEIVRLDLNTVNVSLESADPAVHDKIRGVPGAFRRTTENIKRLIRRIGETGARTEVAVMAVIGPQNAARSNVAALLDYVAGLGANRIVFCPVHDFDCRSRKVELGNIPLDYDISEFLLRHPRRSLIDNSDRYLGRLTEVIGGKTPPLGCVAGYTTLFIDWALNVYPCKAYLETDRPIGNLREAGTDLKELWYSEKYDAFRRSCPACSECFLTVNREFDGIFH